MAQVTPRWQQLVKLSQVFSFEQLSGYRFRQSGGWLLALTVVVAMLFWNWKLLLATSAGVLVMLAVYLMQQWNWQVRLADLRRLLSGSNRQLTIAVGSGGIATIGTYMAVAIWAESESPWMAAAAILQGAGTMATLALLVWQIVSEKASQNEASLSELGLKLTEADALKRLITVRQMTRLVREKKCEKDEQREIADYFRLMLGRETEPVVRDAVLDGLMEMENPNLLGKGAEPFSVSRTKKRSPAKVRRPIYEYEE